MSSIRNEEIKKAFIAYMEEHPDERFWQSIRNFSQADFVLVAEYPTKVEDSFELWVKPRDTFHWETLQR